MDEYQEKKIQLIKNGCWQEVVRKLSPHFRELNDTSKMYCIASSDLKFAPSLL